MIGNGDVTSASAAMTMIDQTGCAGVGIGRGAFYNPWIFSQSLHLQTTGELLPEPPFKERIRVMTRHLDLMVEIFGEQLGCRMFRKVGPWYAKRFGPAIEFNRGIVGISTRAEYDQILEHYLTWREPFLDSEGNLKPSYQPAPMPLNFSDAPASTQRESIPVPSGPVEIW